MTDELTIEERVAHANIDVEYAIKQLRIAVGRCHQNVHDMVTRDCAQRALDALERVQEALGGPDTGCQPEESYFRVDR